MGTTFIQDGDTLDGFIAPTGGVVKDVPVIIGAQFVVPQETVAQTETFLGETEGVHGPFVKDTSSAAVIGAAAYYDPADGKFYAAASATRYMVGTFAVAGASSAAICYVKLTGDPIAVYGVPGDIQGVTAGTGLTGGGTSGTVTVALSTASQTSLGKADTAVQPADITTVNTQTTESAADERVMLQDGATGRKIKAHTTLTKTALDSAVSQAGAAIPKVATPVAGDFPLVAADGTLTAGACKPADFATAAQGGKADTALQAVPANSVTAAMLTTTFLRAYNFSGKNGAGACTMTGAKAGDIVLSVIGFAAGSGGSADFETTITVNDQIQQTNAGDLSTFGQAAFLLKRGV